MQLCFTYREDFLIVRLHSFKSLMQENWTYIRNSSDFLNKTKNIFKIPEGHTLLTSGVIGIYPNTPLGAHL